MKYEIVIEIPKGSDRRIHMKYDGSGFEDFGPIKEKIPINDGVMPVHYGYIEGIKNSTEKDDVDVLVFSTKQLNTGDRVNIEVIGIMFRDDNDHKILAKDDTVDTLSFDDLPEAGLVTKYFGYNKQVSFGDKKQALDYLSSCENSSNVLH